MSGHVDSNVQQLVHIGYVLGSAAFVGKTLFYLPNGFVVGSLIFFTAAVANYLNSDTEVFG